MLMSARGLCLAWLGAVRELRPRPTITHVNTKCWSRCDRWSYGNFKVDDLLGVCAHVIVEAEFVIANFLRSEDKVTLTLLLANKNDLALRTSNFVVEIERAS